MEYVKTALKMLIVQAILISYGNLSFDKHMWLLLRRR